MADYPDWTDLVHIVGTDIMVAVDLQGAYIMMPVDIQAQYVTLNIDIVAQTVGNILVDIKAQSVGNIAVNIAASAVTLNVAIASSAVTLNVNIAAAAVTLNVAIASSAVTFDVDITAQTIANLNINLNAQAVADYTGGEWNVKAGNDKMLCAPGEALSYGQYVYTSYAVPNGKTYFITYLCFHCYATESAESDLNQIGAALLFNLTDGISLAYLGGNGGNSVSFGSPIRIPANKTVRLYFEAYANHDLEGEADCGGYVI